MFKFYIKISNLYFNLKFNDFFKKKKNKPFKNI